MVHDVKPLVVAIGEVPVGIKLIETDGYKDKPFISMTRMFLSRLLTSYLSETG